jgi:prepilin-type N-terminal cleavage/methylation domain-containing protein
MLSRLSKLRQGFTLVEMMIAVSCVVITGGVAFALLQSATTLLLSGHAANRSNQLAYLTMDRLARDVHSSIEVPALVDQAGATITLAGTLPVNAAGIRFRVYAGGPLRIPTATAATATTVGLAMQASQQMPRAGQLLAIPSVMMNGIPKDLYARISSVSPAPPGTSTTPTVTLGGTLGSFATPVATSGNLVEAGSLAYLVNDVAYIVVTPAGGVPELRFYPRAMSVAANGTTAFENPANFVVVTANMAATPQPFAMALGDRGVSVNLTVQDAEYSNRVKSTFTKNFTIGSSSVPVRIYPRSIGL